MKMKLSDLRGMIREALDEAMTELTPDQKKAAEETAAADKKEAEMIADAKIAAAVAKTALKSGSSQQGNARRASVASNCVAANVCVVPEASL